MLHIDGLRVGYDGGIVLHDVTLNVPAGSVHAVVGANGAGKTTLLHTVAGLLRPEAGSITISGAPAAGRSAHRIAGMGVRLVGQGRQVFRRLTVAEHLSLAYRCRDPHPAWTTARVLDLLPALAQRRSHRGNHLSGGEQQMLALACALLGQPRLLLLDEPTEGLAPLLAASIRDTIRAAVADGGLTVVLTESDPAAAASLTTTITRLRHGHITNHTATPCASRTAVDPTGDQT